MVANAQSATLRYDERVAIITGAGGNPSLGRSYALLLAARGARVLVNDLGVGPDGNGTYVANAENVVAEIVAAGGKAVSNTLTVATQESANAIIESAFHLWGRVDILINNAGVANFARFDEISTPDIRRMIDVHLLGTIWMCRAALPYFSDAHYGRIINTSSTAILGDRSAVVYGAAKGGIAALTRGLAVEFADVGIKVNAVAPGALTHAVSSLIEDGSFKAERSAMSPDLVAPVVAYLAHESCTVNGVLLHTRGGTACEMVYAQTAGFSLAVDPEAVAMNLSTILDPIGLTVIPDPVTADAAIVDRPVPKTYRPGPNTR